MYRLHHPYDTEANVLVQHFRGQWRRPPNAPSADHHNTGVPRPIATGPPIMPSAHTRTKLKKFQFIEGAPTANTMKAIDAEKENVVRKGTQVATAKRKETGHPSDTMDPVEKALKTPKPASKRSCPPPSTPATRLPLAELVGNVDDSSRHVFKEVVSPEEQLCWRGSQQINTPLPRKRKRARSSSPVAPSPDDLQMQPQDTNLTTPQADPATELWNRYTNHKGTPTGQKGIAFAHLISEASPRSSATAGSVSGLRRWASCGVEFPASTRKKRRTQAAIEAAKEQLDDIADQPSSDGLFQGQPRGRYNLVDMVEKMRESIKPSSRLHSQMPSSSSPLPDVERQSIPSDSPLKHRGREDYQHEEDVEGEVDAHLQDAVKDDDVFEDDENSGSSDDFGDIDFDDDMVDALEASGTATTTGPVLASQPPETFHAPLAIPKPTSPAPVLSKAQDSDDEFDLDEDIFAEDLEHVASLYDKRTEQTPEQQSLGVESTKKQSGVTDGSCIPPTINLVDDDDEEDAFGDDIDVDEFAAAEVAATQAPTNTVCRSRTA